MDIESKTSIYEEKEETQEVNPEEQKSEIKSEKEKDRVPVSYTHLTLPTIA